MNMNGVAFECILWSNREGMSGIKVFLRTTLTISAPDNVLTRRDTQYPILFDYSQLHNPTFVSVVLFVDINITFEFFVLY